jgi:curved DNA-binding protein CbpA
VRSRPNHYETLGLSPSASDEEIAEAFAHKMSALRWHPVGAKAPVCIAYETLRDAAKRRAYDRSLGLIPKSAPRQWGFAVTPQRWAFIAAEPLGAAPPPEPHVTAAPEPVERRIEEMLAAEEGEQEYSAYGEDRGPSWKKPAVAVAGFVIAAGIIGALAGLSVKEDAGSAQAEPAAAVGRAPPKPQPAAADPAPAPEPAWLASAPKRSSRATARHHSSHKRRSTWAQRQVRRVQSNEIAATVSPTNEVTAKALAVDPLAPRPAAAELRTPETGNQ